VGLAHVAAHHTGLLDLPATLVFDPAWDLTTDVNMRGWAFQLFLNEITRSEPDERGNCA
jgi:hypothetical protein